MGKKKKVTIGYKYFMGLHMGLCRGPVDAIRRIMVGDKHAWAGKADANSAISIDKPDLFGGEEQEGGIQGSLDVMMGAPAQAVNSRLAAMLGGLVSAFRGVTTVFFDGLVCAMSPYPKEWAFLVQKTKKGWHEDDCWYPAKCDIALFDLIPAPVHGAWPWVFRTTTFVVGATHEYTGAYTEYQGWWKGWIHSFRVTKGVARHATTSYPVPTAPFAEGASDPYSSDVVLLVGAVGGAIVDAKGHAITPLGAPSVDAAETLFGQPTIHFNGTSDALLITMGADADLGNGPWTMEAWVKLDAAHTSAFSFGLFGHGEPSKGSEDTRWELLKDLSWAYQQSPSYGVLEPSVAQNIGPKGEAGRWAFVSLCWDGTDYWLHQDGQLLTGIDSAGSAMNPAHILRRLYTDPVIGRGLPASMLDEPSWQAAADTFYGEGFGLCLKWSRTSSVAEFAAEVINHVGAVVYTSRRTGKIVLQPVRGGYDVNDLPLFTPDTGLLAVDDDQAAAQTSGINEVVVKYVDPVAKAEKAVREKNLGAIMASGGVTVSEEVSYPGIPTESLARRVARRDLQAKSGYIKRFTVRLDRRGASVAPGSVFRISDALRGISNIVLRAGRVEYGTALDGTVTITAVQDVFGLPATVLRPPEDNGYQPPDTTVRAPGLQAAFEAPYRELAQAMRAADLEAMTSDAGYLVAAAVPPSGIVQSFTLATRVSPADYASAGEDGLFCPGGALSTAIGYLDTSVTLTGALWLDRIAIGSAALIGSEIVRVDAVDAATATLTIARGCLDTVPAQHAAGTPVICYDDLGATDPQEYIDGVTVDVKLRTSTGAQLLPLVAAPTKSVTFASRAARPYPPAGVKINGERYPEDVSGDITVTWEHRDRLTQADVIVDALAASIGPEAGTAYAVEYYTESGSTPLDSETGITGKTATAWTPPGGGVYRIEVYAERAGLQSWQRFAHVVQHGAAPTDPYWSSVVALLHFDGDLTDETGYVWTEYGSGISIETSSPLMGTGSGKCSGASGDYARSNATTAHVFGTDDFTIEAIIKPSTLSGVQIIVAKQLDSPADYTAIQLRLNKDKPEFVLRPSNTYSNVLTLASLDSISTSSPVHIAATRASGTVRLFVDGELKDSDTWSYNLGLSSRGFMIGASDGSSPGTVDRYTGLIDELRITKGVARYAADFTPPTGPFPNA